MSEDRRWHTSASLDTITPGEAVQLQKQMCSQVCVHDDFGKIDTVAGVDVGFDKKSGVGKAAVAVLRYDSLEPVEKTVAEAELTFPYVPGLLSFREMPLILTALDRLEKLPDLIICDGQGTAHPRRFGIACHLGVVTSIPCIGAAKSRLCGTHEKIPSRKGDWVGLYDKSALIGAVLRSREGVKPIYVSPGHRVSLQASVRIVMNCVTRYKLPETTRHAHNLSLIDRSSSE